MSLIIARKTELLRELSAISDKDERLKAIIEKGKALPGLPEPLKLDSFLIKGCISRAWLVPKLTDGRLSFLADSEAMIVKGIIALLLQVYNDSSPEEILDLSSDFIAEAGITEMLSMNRRNGLSQLLLMIKTYADKASQAKVDP